LERAGCRPIVSTEDEQNELVSRAIYDPVNGIKSSGVPVSQEAVSRLTRAAEALVRRGAKAVVLGCTEIPLAIRGSQLAGVPVFDPTDVLASALIREFREFTGPGSVPRRDGD
jgi:aspartate racemase